MPIVQIKGTLEIDSERGIIYFHSERSGRTMLRIEQLPEQFPIDGTGIEIDHTYMRNHSGMPCAFMLKVGDRVIG
jgi:hypothetical protein